MKKTIKALYAALLISVGLCAAGNESLAQTYCAVPSALSNIKEWITNVSLGGINNTTAAGATAYSDFTSTVSPGQVTVGIAYNLSVSFHADPNGYDYALYAFIDWNQNGVLDNAGEKYALASGVGVSGTYTLAIMPPPAALPGNTRMRVLLDMLDINAGNPCLFMTSIFNSGQGEVEDYTLSVQAGLPVTSVSVATQGGLPASISTNAGTLQMTSTVLPATSTQTVTWSIVPGTGTATISPGGLITAQTNGTAWAKAVSVVDLSKKDSLQITLSNQVTVNSVSVATQGGVPPTITTNAGTLQMTASVLPATAAQTVTWSIVPVSIFAPVPATISTSGLVTAQTNGTVWVKAVSTADAGKKDSLQITLSNQVAPVGSVAVFVYGLAPAIITTNAGTLQMAKFVGPFGSTDTNVIWSIVPVTGTATISATGLVTAQTDGTVWAKAVAVTNALKKDSMLITISNQIPPVASVTVATQGGVPATITTNGNTLQMIATVLPAAAAQTVLWSIVPGTGAASISANGLVSPLTNGTVWAKAVSTADATKKDSLQITISNQVVPITSLTVATQGGVPATITNNTGSLQMTATVLPATAVQTVTWSIVPGTGTASILPSGLVTAQTNGTVWAKAVSTADASKKDSLLITISNQIPPVASVTVATQGGVPATITSNAGSLQMTATVLPANAVQTVTWSIVPGTGTASILPSGLVTAQTNGTVWAKAVSTADASKKDSLLITISNQVVPVTSVTVATQGGVPATITSNAGSLQMTATVLPANAVQTVTWSIVPGTGTASILQNGSVTAQTDGTVWAKAVSTVDASKKDSLLITISNQVAPVNSVTVATQGAVPATITDHAVPLQMTATVLPATASQAVSWSIVPGTGTASISAGGSVTAQSNGTVWAKAVSTADASKMDSLLITISGTGVQDLFTSGAVSVYPNPVSSELIINFDQKYIDGFELSVVNLLGQEVYRTRLNNKRSKHTVTQLVSGTYILSITDTKGNRSSIKVNKQ